MRGRWEVSDLQWSFLEPILRPQQRPDGKGRPPADTRAVLNGVLWILGTGCAVAGVAEQVSSVPDLPSAISAMGAFGGAGKGIAEVGGTATRRGPLEPGGSMYLPVPGKKFSSLNKWRPLLHDLGLHQFALLGLKLQQPQDPLGQLGSPGRLASPVGVDASGPLAWLGFPGHSDASSGRSSDD